MINKNKYSPNQIISRIILSIILLIFVATFRDATAQRHFQDKTPRITPWEIGLSGGFSSFVTSVNPDAGEGSKKINYWNNNLNPGLGLSVIRNISPALGIELSWLNTRLTGTWNYQFSPLAISLSYPVPLTYDSKINQADLLMTFNLNKIIKPGDDIDKWHVYFKPGIGIAHIKDNQNFFPGDSPYLRFSMVFDAGISYSISQKIKLMAGRSYRFANTDNLDGVHVMMVDPDGFFIEQKKVYEIFSYTYLRVNYRFSRSGSRNSKCTYGNKRVKTRIYKKY